MKFVFGLLCFIVAFSYIILNRKNWWISLLAFSLGFEAIFDPFFNFRWSAIILFIILVVGLLVKSSEAGGK